MFLNNVKNLRVHNVAIKRTKPSWESFLKKIARLKNKEPREGIMVKTPFKKPVLAVELEESGRLSWREEEMAQK